MLSGIIAGGPLIRQTTAPPYLQVSAHQLRVTNQLIFGSAESRFFGREHWVGKHVDSRSCPRSSVYLTFQVMPTLTVP